jgi:YD repeat-containing protein
MKKLFTYFFYFLLLNKAFGQTSSPTSTSSKLITKLAEVLPPAPSTSSIARYGGVDIDLNTGAVKKIISLKEITARDIKIPVQLIYNSMGVRVNEYPTRAGMGWNFLAGGVISRVIRGKDDLQATRYIPSFNLQGGEDPATITYCWRLYNDGNNDSEPDIFSFNFDNYSGKFFFDHQGNIIQLSVSNLKIVYNQNTYTDNSWNFLIIAPNGYKYYFGGPNAKEESKSGPSSRFSTYYPTAWHLNRIEHPTGYVVNFSYETQSFGPYLVDVVEEQFKGSPTSGSGCGSSVSIDAGVVNVYHYAKVALLKEINTNIGSKVEFKYGSGYPENILTSITYIDENGLAYYKYGLEYNLIQSVGGSVIPFLYKIKEMTGQGRELHNGHVFTYYNTGDIPKRFSFSQDHWGYYNGKSNSTLVPPPSDPTQVSYFPNSTADRNPDPAKAVNGLLSTIMYPTGGKDEIIYEANKYGNTIVGGMRVQKITTSDITAGTPTVKRYYYGTLADREASSAMPVAKPIYLTPFEFAIITWGDLCTPMCTSYQSYTANFSYTLNKMQLYGDKFIQYSSVIESLGGDNYENGAVEHKFHIVQDNGPQVILGTINTLYSSFTNSSYLSKGEIETNVYSNKGGVLTRMVSKTRDVTIDVNRKFNDIPCYFVAEHSSLPCLTWNSSNQIVGPSPIFKLYSIHKYYITSAWKYLSKETTVNYDANGENPVTEIMNYYYDDDRNLLVNRIEIKNSKGETIKRQFKYPHDFAATGNVYQNMVDRNMIDPSIEVKTFKDNTLLLTEKMNYSDSWFANKQVVAMSSVEVQKEGYANETRFSYAKYDSYGKPLSFSNQNDIVESFLWNDFAQPVSKTVNAPFEDIAYTSFEDLNTQSGNWNISKVRQLDWALTGRKSYAVQNTITNSNPLNTSRQYIISYWSRNPGAFTIAGTISGYPVKGKTINGWSYYEHRVTGLQYYSITGTGIIDEVRLLPVNAQMVTLTYKPQIGITAQTDVNNIPSFYSYDDFGRLSSVTDENKNILKKYCYNYTGQIENCTLFPNVQKSGVFVKVCPAGYTGSAVNYIVPEGTYLAATQTNADAMAQTDVDLNGQTYANAIGSCAVTCTTSNCSGNDKKCVNNVCQTGVKVYTSSVFISTHYYECTYHYEWSDGSWSQNYTEYSNTNCSNGPID